MIDGAKPLENIEEDAAQSPAVFNALNINVLKQRELGYNRPFVPDLPPEGSVLGATWRKENFIGSYLNSVNLSDFDESPKSPDYNYLDYIPSSLAEKWGHLYSLTTNPEQADELTGQINQEIADNVLRANHPWRAFASTIAVSLADPAILLPGGTIYKTLKGARNVAKSALSVGTAAMGQAALEEVALHQTQLTRELDESVFNILGAGIVGSVIGGLGGAFTYGALAKKAQRDIVESLADESPIGPKLTPEQSLSAMAVTDPELKKDLNSLYGGTPTAAIGKFLGWMTQKFAVTSTPFGRLLFSPFPSSRAIVNELLEHNLVINANLPGRKTYIDASGKEVEVTRDAINKPIAVESEIKALKRSAYKALIDYQKIFYEQAGIAGPLKGIQAKIRKQGLTINQFEKEVWRTVIRGTKSENAAVQKAADLVVNRFFEPTKEQYIKLGIFSPDITTKTAANYFMRVYNKKRLMDPVHKAATKEKFSAWIKKNNEELITLSPQIEEIQGEIAALKKQSATTKKAERKAIKERIEALKKTLDDLVPYYLWNSDGEIRRIIDPDYYAIEAEKIIDNILGLNDERALNPLMKIGTSPKFLRERAFLIPDELIEDELVTSFLEVAPMFINASAPHIAMTRYAHRLGLKTPDEARNLKIKEIEADFKREEAKAGNDAKKITKLEKKMQKDKKDINALFDILNGVYGLGPNVMDDSAARFVKNLSTYNYIKLMGMITLQSFTDIGAIGLKHGLFRTMHTLFSPVWKELLTGSWDKEQLRDLGFVINTFQGHRLKAMIDQEATNNSTGLFTNSLNYLADSYGNMTLMNQWTDAMEFIAGKMSIARTLRTIDKYIRTGKIKKNEALRLNELGIEKSQYAKIHEQYKKHGGKTGGSHWVNWGKWDSDNDSLRALAQFKTAIIKEVEQTVINGPGLGQKPLYATKSYGNLGALIFQFKGFSYAATNKLLISGLQRGDMEFYTGLPLLFLISGLGYIATSKLHGEEPDLSFNNMFKECLDRSGLPGVLGNGYNLLNKLGLIPGKEVTRYRNRGPWSAIGGPTIGMAEDSYDLLKKLMHLDDANYTTNDMYKVYKNLPWQNYWGLNYKGKQVAKDFALHLGWEESPE